MKIHHIDATTFCPVSARVVNGAGGWLAPARMVCHCWLVESNDGLILVDTGIGSEDFRDPATRLGPWFARIARPIHSPLATAIAQVKKLGFDPRDVRHIIPTHLDLDHAGGLPDFPWATVHIFRPEHQAAMRRATLRERERYRAVHFAHGPRWDLREGAGERWFGFDGVQAIDGNDDVLLIPLVGHTRGHSGVAVRTAGGWVLHAGDAYFSHGEMEATPSCPPGLRLFQRLVAVDDAQRRANQARLQRLVQTAGGEVTVHCAHCPVELARFTV